MAKKKKDSITVAKWGGQENLGTVDFDGHKHEAASIEVKSDTKLTDDPFEGALAIVRKFTFGANLESWKQHTPTKQELFNAHAKGIEMALWRDGMAVNDKITPQISFDEKKKQYHIFVGAKVARGHIIPYDLKPTDLSKIAHGI